ncbi:Homeobox-leucine zipper protein ROC1 [Ananas comosus]|uniref:Homeobox-leucine zipper protein ROC1 n=1 Tax=Ananas comosus TaxID=4615 RepID=A0A199UHI3_ANACO|nr:Homeobox-leucine zipper protein ROC1 [Ananas comosus]
MRLWRPDELAAAAPPSRGHALGGVAAAAHPSGSLAAAASLDSSVRVFDVDSNASVPSLDAPSPPPPLPPPRQLIDIFMNVNSYESFFSSIVSTASTVEAFPAEVQGSDDKTLQLMKEEFRFPSPLVLKRECVFLRYCKQHGEGPWAVVDVSFDGHGYSEKINTDSRDYTKMTCRRRPSGCIIKTMQDGSSKVVWVEHVEVDDGGVHEMYKPFVNSGLAFGASQWITTIDRHVMAINNSIFEYNDRPIRDTFCVLNKDGTGISYGLLFAFGQVHDFFRKIVYRFTSKDTKENPEHRPISSLTGGIAVERD